MITQAQRHHIVNLFRIGRNIRQIADALGLRVSVVEETLEDGDDLPLFA